MARSDLLIRGGRIADPAGDVLLPGDVLIRDGAIVEVASSIDADVPVLDATGLVVAPGFIDLHAHFREPGQEWKEDIASGSRAAVAGGFTTVCLMPNTVPALHDQERVRFVMARGREVGLADLRVVGAATIDIAGSKMAPLGEMAQAGCVAFSDDGHPILDSGLMRRILEYAGQFELPVVQHAEDTGLTRGGAMNEGVIATRLGLGAMPRCAEDIIVHRDIALLEITGGHLHIAHASSAVTMDLVREARERGLQVTCEVTPHHLFFDENWVASCHYDANYKMNPPLRASSDRDALIEACIDGTVDAIATDHAPHLPDEKEMGFGAAPFGVIGLETAFAAAVTVLLPHLSLPRLLRLFTTGPARVFGFDDRGRLEPGLRGDVVLLDPEAEFIYDVASSASRSRNSPFHGQRLRGRVVATVSAGRLVHGGGNRLH